ncbi:MAG: tetratricopeptide repeat protein [Planctomycetes bacterium]|nr:tetratricopeptide repeat protein [Planctomycetota bacterium]
MTASPAAGSSPPVHATTNGSEAPKVNRLAAFLVALVAFVMYAETAVPPGLVPDTLGREFGNYLLVYDDSFLIVQNELMQTVPGHPEQAFDFFKHQYWDGVNPQNSSVFRSRGQALYRPLTLFVWGLVAGLRDGGLGSHPWPYHLVSVLANVWVTWLLYVVALRLFRSQRVALLAALLFAVHPVHSEAVAYVAGLSDVLAAGAVLLGLLFFEKAVRDRSRVGVLAVVGLMLTMFVGLLAKETGVLVLAAVFLTDLMFSLTGRAPSGKQRAAIYGALVLTLVAHLAVRMAVLAPDGAGFAEAFAALKPDATLISRLDNPLTKVDTPIRVLNSFKLMAKYVWLLLYPANLSVDYSYNQIHTSLHWSDPEPLAGTVLMGAIVLVGLLKLKRSPAFGWGLLLFAGCTAFTSNMLVPIGTIFADRTMYLPSAGAAVAVAVVLDRLLGSQKAANPVGLLVSVVLLGSLGYLTFERNQDFKTPVGLFESAAESSPNSSRVHYQLGSIYVTQGLFDKAKEELEASLAIDPTYVPAAMKLADTFETERNHEKAIEKYTEILNSLGITGDPEQTNYIRSTVLSGRAAAKRALGDLDGARADLEQAMAVGAQSNPQSALQLVDLLQGQERWTDSIPVIDQVLAADPQNVTAIGKRAKAAIATQDKALYDSSIAMLEQTEKGRPLALQMKGEVKYESALRNHDQAELDQAMSMFDEAARLDDTLATPYVFKGRYLVERPPRRFFDAITQYDRALERDPLHPAALLYKAIAQLAVGEPEGALETLATFETVNKGVACYTLMLEAYFRLGDVDAVERMAARIREYGKEPIQVIINRAVSYDSEGETEKAIEIIDQGITLSEPPVDPQLLRHRALFLYELGRYEEAFAEFTNQRQSEQAIVDALPDPFLPINLARTLIALGRLPEAAAELDTVEHSLADLDPTLPIHMQLLGSLLQWRSTLLLQDGALFDPGQAAKLAAEGLDVTRRRHPPFFELSIEALLASGDLSGAVIRAREAKAAYPEIEHFAKAADALALAENGKQEAAKSALADDPDEFLQKLVKRM